MTQPDLARVGTATTHVALALEALSRMEEPNEECERTVIPELKAVKTNLGELYVEQRALGSAS